MPATIARILATGVVLSSVVAAALAQGPPGMPPPPGGMGVGMDPGGPGGPPLAMIPEVQEDLGLTDKQKDQLKRVGASTAQRRRQAFAEGAEGGFDPQAIGSAMAALSREQDATVGRVLDKAQKARLAQIELQREGKLAVARKDVAAKLKLTSAQSKKVKAIVDEMRQSQARLMPRPAGGPGGPPPGGGFPEGGPLPGANFLPGGSFPAGGDVPPGGGFPPGGGNVLGGGNPGDPPKFPRPDFNSPEFRAQFAKMRESGEKLRSAASAKVEEVLTPDQKVAFEALLGKPFDFSKLAPGPGPGGPPPDGEAPPAGAEGRPKSATKKGRPAMQPDRP